MFDEATVERRLTALEQEVADLKRQLAIRQPAENWIERVSMIVTDKEVLREASEYGRQIRQADRPCDDPASDP
jgi:hypothetical protein